MLFEIIRLVIIFNQNQFIVGMSEVFPFCLKAEVGGIFQIKGLLVVVSYIIIIIIFVNNAL